MPDRPWKDEYTLLCERCGYVTEGLDTSGNCPECGKPIVESLPERRVGTPWQQSPGVESLANTWWLLLSQPSTAYQRMRTDRRETYALCWISILVASLTILPASLLMFIGLSIVSGFFINNIFVPVLFTVAGIAYWACAGGYAMLAVLRLRAFARLRSCRLTPNAAHTTASHASMGLSIAPLLVSLSLIMVLSFELANVQSELAWKLIVWTMWASIPISIVWFEILLIIGYRRLRNRNHHTTHSAAVDANCAEASP